MNNWVLSTSLTQLIELLKFKKTRHQGKGEVPGSNHNEDEERSFGFESY